MEKLAFNSDRKFDIQLSAALIHERKLGEVFAGAKLEAMQAAKFELKTETYQWRRTGNIAIEYARKGQPSGIAVTAADFWVHDLCDDEGQTLGYFLFPIQQLKRLCRDAFRRGHYRERGGDRGEFDVILLNIEDLNQWMFGRN